MTVKIIRRNPEALKEVYKQLGHKTGKVVKVGFPKGMAEPYPDGTSVAYIAACHVYGAGVPERDFFKWGHKDIEKTTKEFMRAIAKEAKTSKEADALLEAAGRQAQSDIQKAITDLNAPPNAPQTIAKKGSSNPLIDTEHMRDSVTYIVEDK